MEYCFSISVVNGGSWASDLIEHLFLKCMCCDEQEVLHVSFDMVAGLAAGDGALLGAGVSVLGPIRVGAGCKVGAGSVVVKELPDYCVAVGVPARIIKQLQIKREPSVAMDQCDDFILDYMI